jgi:hypothetical protein
MVDEMVGKMAKKITKMGEKTAPVKSLKLKVKFQGTPKSKALRDKK